MRRRYPPHKVITAIVAAWLLIPLTFCLAVPWYQARLPKDMPKNSIWIDAPRVPLGFYHGWWQGCWAEMNGRTTQCKTWGPRVGTVYTGEYGACDGHPVSFAELSLDSRRSDMWWTSSARMNRLLPVAVLQNGRKLVPKDAPDACANLDKVNPQ